MLAKEKEAEEAEQLLDEGKKASNLQFKKDILAKEKEAKELLDEGLKASLQQQDMLAKENEE